MDDNLRAIQAVVRQYLASPGSTIVSASTVDLSTADGRQVPISGSATVTGLGTEVSGLEYLLTTTGIQTWKNSSSMLLPGAADYTSASGDYLLAVSKGSGNWVIPWITKMAIGSTPPFIDSSPLIQNASSAVATVRLSASGVTAARVATFPDADLTIVGLTTSQSVTNKTLVAPVLNSSVSGTSLADSSVTLAAVAAGLLLTPAGFAGNKTLAASGYYKFPGGLTLQWFSGVTNATPGNGSGHNFPTPFSTSVYGVLCAPYAQTVGAGAPYTIGLINPTTSSVTSQASNASLNFFAVAVGV